MALERHTRYKGCSGNPRKQSGFAAGITTDDHDSAVFFQAVNGGMNRLNMLYKRFIVNIIAQINSLLGPIASKALLCSESSI